MLLRTNSVSNRFDLDLANNLEVEFLIYSWDPQLRHRLCYRSSLRLGTLFSKVSSSFQCRQAKKYSKPVC